MSSMMTKLYYTEVKSCTCVNQKVFKFFFLVKQLPVANICGVVEGDVYQYHFHYFLQNTCIHPGVLLLAVSSVQELLLGTKLGNLVSIYQEVSKTLGVQGKPKDCQSFIFLVFNLGTLFASLSLQWQGRTRNISSHYLPTGFI